MEPQIFAIKNSDRWQWKGRKAIQQSPLTCFCSQKVVFHTMEYISAFYCFLFVKTQFVKKATMEKESNISLGGALILPDLVAQTIFVFTTANKPKLVRYAKKLDLVILACWRVDERKGLKFNFIFNQPMPNFNFCMFDIFQRDHGFSSPASILSKYQKQ